MPRHQTVKSALLDWRSFDLSTPARKQSFFESLSVFAGGCTFEAAVAVCGAYGEDDFDVIDLITSLVTKSLLVAESIGAEQRYRLLESTRHYLAAKLVGHGEHPRNSTPTRARLFELAGFMRAPGLQHPSQCGTPERTRIWTIGVSRWRGR